jgi:hypothetical protein
VSHVMVINGDDDVVGPFEDEAIAHALAASLALDRAYSVKPLVDPESFEIGERDALGVPTPLARMSPARRFGEFIDAGLSGDLDRVAAYFDAVGQPLTPDQRQRWADQLSQEPPEDATSEDG